MRAIIAVTIFALAASQARAGLEFEIETRDFEFTPPRVERSKISAEGVVLKMESRDARTGMPDTVIFRGDRNEMMVVDHQQRSFMIIDKQFAANMAGQLQQMAGQMQGMLDSVPADQRALIAQMTNGKTQPNGQISRPQTSVQNTGQQASVYGYPCVLFTVSREGRKVRDVWVTNWNNIQGSRNLTTAFESMSQFTEELLASFPPQAQQQAPMHDNAFTTISKMGGFPVASREYGPDGRVESESALRSATYRQISATEWLPPSGYQQQSFFGGSPMSAPSAQGSMYGQSRR